MKAPLLFLVSLLIAFCACQSQQNASSQKSDTLASDIIVPQRNKWEGSWHRNEFQNLAAISIRKMGEDSFAFELGASSGGHTGNIDGIAYIKGNKAYYSSTEDYDKCRIEFELKGDSLIVISQFEGECQTAMGVTYTGDYYNENYKSAKKEDETLASINLLENPEDDKIFKELVGSDYDLFVSSTQLTNEDDDLDSFNAKVYSSGVRGLFTQMENIIMINDRKEIWAAVIDDEQVKYYTNREDYRNKIPKTIENWREHFKEYPVLYQSSK